MNKIKRFFVKRKKEKEYRAYIDDHKKKILRAYYEMIHCKDLEWIIKDSVIMKRLWDRALVHDDDKYEKEIFHAYRKHYFPINEEEKEKAAKDYKKAWDYHKKNNDHHWQARTNWKNEDFNIDVELACLENIMDWLAVGYNFKNRPYEYYEKHKEDIKLPKKQIDFMEKCIYEGIDKKYILKNEGTYDVWNEL